MYKEIITLTGIVLREEREQQGLFFGITKYYVNGTEVAHWTYERTGDDFYTEDIFIKSIAVELPLPR